MDENKVEICKPFSFFRAVYNKKAREDLLRYWVLIINEKHVDYLSTRYFGGNYDYNDKSFNLNLFEDYRDEILSKIGEIPVSEHVVEDLLKEEEYKPNENEVITLNGFLDVAKEVLTIYIIYTFKDFTLLNTIQEGKNGINDINDDNYILLYPEEVYYDQEGEKKGIVFKYTIIDYRGYSKLISFPEPNITIDKGDKIDKIDIDKLNIYLKSLENDIPVENEINENVNLDFSIINKYIYEANTYTHTKKKNKDIRGRGRVTQDGEEFLSVEDDQTNTYTHTHTKKKIKDIRGRGRVTQDGEEFLSVEDVEVKKIYEDVEDDEDENDKKGVDFIW